jgi:hypothetical protein
MYGKDAAAAVELEVDSLFGSSSSSDEDDSSVNEEDDEERADDITALGFMKSLCVDMYTPEDGVDESARSNFEAGASGIAGLAASAASGVFPATSYVYGYPNAVGTFSSVPHLALRISGPVVLSNSILEQFRQIQTMPSAVAVSVDTPSQVSGQVKSS